MALVFPVVNAWATEKAIKLGIIVP